MMDATRRGNYESGSDYVLEYGELRFTFNERDFTERVEQAAIKLGFIAGPLAGDEREDLVNLAVNGEVSEPASALGEHIVSRWTDLAGSADRSLVHWLRRLVFRGAWLDQRVKEGELEKTLERIEKIGAEAAARVKKNPESGFRTTTVMMHFEGPSTTAGLPEDAGIRRHKKRRAKVSA